MAFSYQVNLSDPTNAGGSFDPILVGDLERALAIWSEYVQGIGTLVLQLNIENTTRENGGPTSSFFVGTNNGLNVFEPSSLYELTTGHHVAGTTSDITINVDPGYLQSLDLAPNLTENSALPANELNPIDIFLHEIEHGLGMVGYYSQAGVLAGNESTFDRLIQFDSSGKPFFVGLNAENAYGGPVPLTHPSTSGENLYHFGDTQGDFSRSPSTVQDPLTLDLMNGIVTFLGHHYSISDLDVGVLKDIGYNIVNQADGTSGNDAFHASSMDAFFRGDGGHDTLTFDGPSAQYSRSTTILGTVIVTDGQTGRDGQDQTEGVEFLHFTDKIIFVETADGANIARLYSAALGREPDVGGQSGWEDIYANDISSTAKAGGVYLALAQTPIAGAPNSIAGGFTLSTEFQQHYGALYDGGFVSQLYENVLSRAPSIGERDA